MLSNLPGPRTTLSQPQAPPSTVPLTAPDPSNTNVSSLSAAPWRFSIRWNEKEPRAPEPAPSIFQRLFTGGPRIVSLPAPPSNVTPIVSAATPESIESVSFPSPPTTARSVTEASGRTASLPSIPTTRSEPLRAIVIVWSAPLATVTVHGAGAVAGAVAETDEVAADVEDVAGVVEVAVVGEIAAW